MKRLVVILAAGSLWAGAAYADEVVGTIKAVNTGQRTVTLDNDMTYSFVGRVDLTKVKVGDKVKVTFEPSSALWVSLGIHGSGTEIATSN